MKLLFNWSAVYNFISHERFHKSIFKCTIYVCANQQQCFLCTQYMQAVSGIKKSPASIQQRKRKNAFCPFNSVTSLNDNSLVFRNDSQFDKKI